MIVTGVGSLPHAEPLQALDFVARWCPRLPYWPQLPQRSAQEGMVHQALAPAAALLAERPQWGVALARNDLGEFLDTLADADPAAVVKDAAAWEPFLAEAPRLCLEAKGMKAQCIGPATLARCVFIDGKAMAEDAKTCEALAAWIERVVLWMAGQLPLRAHLWLDEPMLMAASPTETTAVASILASLRNAGHVSGMHCCGQVPWNTVRRCAPEEFSFDAGLVPEADLASEDFIACAESPLIPGIALTRRAEERRAETAVCAWLEQRGRLSMLAPSCGLGLATMSDAEGTYERLYGVKQSWVM